MANGFLPLSSTSWPVFLGLRDGTVHTVYGLNSEGIITFPSLHAALGVLFPAALWRVRKLRWIALTLNGLLLLATPVYGSHYMVDVAAGILVAAACWFAVAPRFAVAATGARDHATMIHAPVPIVPQASPPREALRYREMLNPLENKIPAA
jgi:membrane-associated phospholipid phosphatase